MTRLKSMNVTIEGVTRSYDFGDGAEVSSDDEGEASLELLRDAETTEVVLSQGIESARVTVDFTYTFTGSVEVDLDDLGGEVEDLDDVEHLAEQGNDDIFEAITEEVGQSIGYEYVTIDSVAVDEAFDDSGNTVI